MAIVHVERRWRMFLIEKPHLRRCLTFRCSDFPPDLPGFLGGPYSIGWPSTRIIPHLHEAASNAEFG
jgi:hypothetical protein